MPAAQPGEILLHRDGQGRQSGGAHRLQQGVAAGKVPIRRVGDHAGAACRLAQHHRIGPAVTGEGNPRIQQRLAQVPVVVAVAQSFAARRIHHHRSASNVDTVH